jgi:hypothetical protein
MALSPERNLLEAAGAAVSVEEKMASCLPIRNGND